MVDFEHKSQAHSEKAGQQTVDFSALNILLVTVEDALQASRGQVMDLIGYSNTAHNGWERKGKAPLVAYWAVSGLIASRRGKEEQELTFTDEELKDICVMAISADNYPLSHKAVDILRSRRG